MISKSQLLASSMALLMSVVDGSFGDSDVQKATGSRKRFVELCTILEPGRPTKTDKGAILIDAARMVTQLRGEVQKLKDFNSSLGENIKELKAEKNELRDEKQKLKAEKDKVEQQLATLTMQPTFIHPPGAQSQAPGSKLVPFLGYPGMAMWQFMPPAAVDTSQDHVLRPPVASLCNIFILRTIWITCTLLPKIVLVPILI